MFFFFNRTHKIQVDILVLELCKALTVLPFCTHLRQILNSSKICRNFDVKTYMADIKDTTFQYCRKEINSISLVILTYFYLVILMLDVRTCCSYGFYKGFTTKNVCQNVKVGEPQGCVVCK